MKEFLKHVSVYGMLPIIGKFAGFFLIPIYARIFSSYQFGIVELLLTLTSFMMFGCNLEFYTAIGRFFYDKEDLRQKKILVSTGLFLTLFFTIIVIAFALLAENIIIKNYLDNGNYYFEYRISMIWLFFSAIYTYLGVIPRYDKKPKLYVLISVVSLLVRIGSTIVYVLIFNAGIAGVIYGHITGSITSAILNSLASWKYLGFMFNIKDAKSIFKFSVPIVPGLLIIGYWYPLSRNLVSKYFSIETLGLMAFALRITSVMEIINTSIRMAWNPLLFENYKKPTFKNDVFRISKFTCIISLFGAISLTLLSPEICIYIGTVKYSESTILVGFFAFQGSFEILRRLRGFGPLILKKTYILTINEIIGISIGSLMLIFLNNKLGLIGIGLAFLLPSIIKYIFLISYTSRKLSIKFHSKQEFFLIIILCISLLLIFFKILFLYRLVLLGIITLSCLFMILDLKKAKKQIT